VPQECEVKCSKSHENKAALYPATSIGTLASDYVVRAVPEEEGKQEIELSSKYRSNDEGCSPVCKSKCPFATRSFRAAEAHELDVDYEDPKKRKAAQHIRCYVALHTFFSFP
jgi:hypothetical protein